MTAMRPDMRIIDLSVPIAQTRPGAIFKVNIQYMSHLECTRVNGPMLGFSEQDVPDGLSAAQESISLTTHSGTHLDAPWHFGPLSEGKPARTIDQVPLEWCFSDGVVLDFRHKRTGEEILIEDLRAALETIGYTLKPFDIVLVMTGASKQYSQPDYMNRHAGMTRESTLWLIDQGIKVMGIDAWGWDRPFKVMAEELRHGVKGRMWAAHIAGREKEYCHLENLANLDLIPRPHGFKVAVFPIKVERASGSWVRAVAIL